jgi:photosystem II stability/assembly factor-like uncharacterized protein
VLFLLGAVVLAPPAAADPLPGGWQSPAIGTAHVAGVTITAAAPHTMYAAGDGVYRSTDGGASWTALTTAFSTAEVQPAPSNGQILYAATGDGCASGKPGTLWRSADGGATWQPRSGGPASLHVSAADADDLLGIGCAGVYRSRDGGQSWQLLPGSGVPNFDGQLLVRGHNDPAYLYAVFASEGGTTGLARSRDGGQTWRTQVLADLPGPGDLAVDPRDARRLTFVSFAGCYVSTDAGATWTARNTGLPRAGEFDHLSTAAYDAATGTWYLGSADPTQPRGVFRLGAGGAWTAVTSAPAGQAIARLVFVSAGSGPALLAVTSAGALYRVALPGASGPPGVPRTGGGAGATGPAWALLAAALVGVGLGLRRHARQRLGAHPGGGKRAMRSGC